MILLEAGALAPTGPPLMEYGGGLELKSREPKERKSSTKPRKSSGKSKRPRVDPPLQAAEPETDPPEPGAGTLVSAAALSKSDRSAVAAMEQGNGASAPDNGATEAAATDLEPPLELIRARAYELFVQRGYEHGHHLEDWLIAERELKTR